jgi:transposase
VSTESRCPKRLALRRLKAAQLLNAGKRPSWVARELRVSLQSVIRWQKLLSVGGVKALARIGKVGPVPRLTSQQMDQLQRSLRDRPPLYPRLRQKTRWTQRVTQEYLRDYLGASFHVSHCRRLLRQVTLDRPPVGR